MTAIPMSQLFGISSKLAASACCGWFSQQVDQPAVGILLGAAVLVPLALSLEEIFQLSARLTRVINQRGGVPQQPAMAYPEGNGLAHSGMR